MKLFFYHSLVLLVTLGCNKNTNELPPLRKETLVVSNDTIHEPMIDFIFTQNYNTGQEEVSVQLKNNTSQPLYELEFLCEFCRDTNVPFSCYRIADKIDALLPGQLSRVKLLWTDKTIPLNKQHIKGKILSYQNSQPDLGEIKGNYRQGYAMLQKDVTSPYRTYYEAHATIMHQGEVDVFIKFDSVNYFSIHGMFYENEVFKNGLLRKNGLLITPVTIDSMIPGRSGKTYQYQSGQLDLRVRLATPVNDTLYFFTLHLVK